MTFFVDANVLIYAAVPCEYREPCIEILEAVARGDAAGQTSTAALEEVWYIELSGKVSGLEGLTERAYKVFAPLLPVTDGAFRQALSLEAPRLGPNDRLHVGTCLAHGIGTLVSADLGFDGVSEIRRLDPRDEAARQSLVGSPGS